MMAKPKRHKVEWTHTARADLSAIISDIAEDSIASASSVLSKSEQAAKIVTTLPLRGRIVPELAAFGVHTYREIVVSPWRIICRHSGTTVYVLAVADGRRNLEDLLLERFLR